MTNPKENNPPGYVIGLDTSGDNCSVAFVRDGLVLNSATKNAPGNQLLYLVPLINDLMEKTSLSRSGYTGVGVTTGPGSYTGLRLGLATAKTLAQVLDVPVVGLNTLDIIAKNAPPGNGCIIPVMDARKKEFFFAAYIYESGKIERISNYNIGGIDKLASFISGHNDGIYILGSGVPFIAGTLRDNDKIHILPDNFWYPKAETVAVETEKIIAKGRGSSYKDIDVFYLREPDAIPLEKQVLK
ncbi:MAG: tRNA (adenosine(37)-N6)-threonylcarbamoyltransferase complex dimerization subunit type 1 TsaB [Chloroflexi bacterium]|nr:tRNA (adenosine(37)-N6)-threonylcarbamoyltransferase complex dimerization subunit type 1 TsaB [Chloroflexota bacterium]